MIRFPLLKVSRFFSGVKYLREQDTLSQYEIDSILGNQLEEFEQQSKRKQLQRRQSSDIAKQFFYNLLPVRNQIYPICKDPDQVILEETPNQNIFVALGLPKTVSFQEYTQALSHYRTETELYGDESQKSVIDPETLEFKELIDPDSKLIALSKSRQLINISLPGTIQIEDPRNFMELRPIEQFRHTPLYPISDQAIKKHQEMLDEYHRRQFVFEINKESALNWVFISIALGIGSYMIYLVLQKEEQKTVSYARLKHKRTMGESGDTGFRM